METRALTIHVAPEAAQAYETASPEVRRQVDDLLSRKLRETMRSLARQNDKSSRRRGERALALLRGSATAGMTTGGVEGHSYLLGMFRFKVFLWIGRLIIAVRCAPVSGLTIAKAWHGSFFDGSSNEHFPAFYPLSNGVFTADDPDPGPAPGRTSHL